MIELSDEVLCTYIDAELDAPTASQIEQALASDAGARVRLERMRAADALLRKAIPEPVIAVDDPLAQLINVGAPAEKQRASQRIKQIAARRPIFFGSLAAGLGGLVLGALLAPRFIPNTTADRTLANMSRDTGKSVVTALDTINSGSTLQRNDDTVRMILSFHARDGRHCRVFDLSNPSGGAEGVACRNEKQWQIVAWDATRAPADGFRTAGSSELIDGVMNRLGGIAALELADEQKLIDEQWHR